LPEEKSGMGKRSSQMILNSDELAKEKSDLHAQHIQEKPPPPGGEKVMDSNSEGAYTADFSNIEQKPRSPQKIDSPQLKMNTLELSTQREDSVTCSHKGSAKSYNRKRRDSNISISSRGGKYGLSESAKL